MSQAILSAVLHPHPPDATDALDLQKAQVWQRMAEDGASASVGRGDALMLACRDPRCLVPPAHHSIQCASRLVAATNTKTNGSARGGGGSSGSGGDVTLWGGWGGERPWLVPSSAAAAAVSLATRTATKAATFASKEACG